MIKTPTALLGAGILLTALSAPLLARADTDDAAMAFVVGAAFGHAVGDRGGQLRYAYYRPDHYRAYQEGRDHRGHHRGYDRPRHEGARYARARFERTHDRRHHRCQHSQREFRHHGVRYPDRHGYRRPDRHGHDTGHRDHGHRDHGHRG